MRNFAKEIAAAAGGSAADSESRNVELRHSDPTESGTRSPAPQKDRLAEKFEVALAAALGSDAPKPTHSMESDISLGGSTDCADPKHRRVLRDGGQADCRDSIAWESTPVAACAAPFPSRLALAAQEASAEPDSNSPAVVMHLMPPNLGDPVDSREEMAEPGLLALWSRRCDGKLIRRGVLSVGMLGGLAGLAAVLVMPVMTPGNPTDTVAEEGDATQPWTVGSADRAPNDQRWELSEDMGERHPAAHVAQEPVSPKLVKTVRITAKPDQFTDVLARAEAPSLGAVHAISSERGETSTVVRTDPELSSTGQSEDKTDSAEWSEGAVRNASPAERVEFGEREGAVGDEALVESEPQVAAPSRWATSIPFEDNDQTTDRMSAASEADESEPANGESAPGAAATGADTAAAEAENSSELGPVEESPPAEPTRFAAVTADVNMRAGAGKNAAVITVVPAGRRVGVIDCGAWCEVVFEGDRGWVYSSFVASASSTGAARADVAGDRIAAGTPLISADGAQIGIIRGLTKDGAGQDFVVVDLPQELNAAVPTIRLKAEYIAAKDEHARIDVTRARFVRSLPSESGAEASAVAGAD